jgi:hypothetical protein
MYLELLRRHPHWFRRHHRLRQPFVLLYETRTLASENRHLTRAISSSKQLHHYSSSMAAFQFAFDAAPRLVLFDTSKRT